MASEYHRGEMDIHGQTATYHGFNMLMKWGSVANAVVLTALVIWFCTPGGFFLGAGAGLALLVLSIIFLREKKGGH